ncbi:hypothetical protein Aperf_G00000036591 [Anoplocephala perfoliata]
MQRKSVSRRAVSITILLYFLLGTACAAKSKVILVSMDGFRYDYLDMAKSQGRNISEFEALYQRGFRGRIVPIMPTITFPTHVSAATGRHAENHGIMNNVFYDPKLNATFSYKSANDLKDPKWWNYNGDEPIWMTNERLGYKSCTYFWPGSASPYNGKLPTKAKLVYNRSINFPQRVDEIIQWMREDDKITLCLLYIREPDATGHMFGPDSREVMDRVEELNDVVGHMIQLVSAAPNLRDSVNIILTSDHGMAEVLEENVIKLYDILNPEDYIPNPSRTFVGIWPKPGGPTVLQMYTKLIEANITGGSIFLKGNLPPHYHFAGSTRTPPLIVVADPQHTIHIIPPKYPTKGDHGYDNRDKRMHASLVAAGPNIKQATGVREILQIDIYPFVCGLLTLDEPNKIDGNLRRVVDLISLQPNEEFVRKFMFYAQSELIDSPPDAANKNSFGILTVLLIVKCPFVVIFYCKAN